jgi:beta-xylosidase
MLNMRNLILLVAGLVSAGSVWCQKNGNPIFPGWYADPEAIVFDNRFWIYPTYSAPYEQQVFIDAFSSTDLKTWKKHPKVIDTAAVKWAKKAMWAPAIIRKDGLYYLFFSANDVHPGEIGGIGVAVADRPEGPFKDLLGKPLVGEVHNGAQPIDQFVFHDSDGQYYMIYGGWRHCNIVKVKPDFTGLQPFANDSLYKEGPFVFVRDGRYYFMWSEGGWTGPDYKVAYAVSDNIMGPFKRIGTVLQQDSAVATGAGHHSVIQVPGKDEWYIVYHRRPLGDTGRDHRVVCIDRMEFDEQGMIKPVKMSFSGVKQLDQLAAKL